MILTWSNYVYFKHELDTAACDAHSIQGAGVRESENDYAQWYGWAEFHEAEIHLDSLHVCDDSGCKHAPRVAGL